MLSRILLVLTFCTFLFVNAQSTQAAEINSTTYDIYIGDVNGDGAKDFFFKCKPFFLILYGDVATPILYYKNTDFAIYRNGNDYSAPVGITLTESDMAARIANGSLKLAANGTDYVSWNNGVVGRTNLLLRGADSTAPALMISSYADVALPTLSRTYLPQNYPGISDRSIRLTLADINYDGLQDIVLEDISTSAAWKAAYIASADASTNGVPTYYRELRPSTGPTAGPIGGGNILVGTTAAQFRVDESGAATYEVPISVAEGVAGVKPALSLGYSSNAGIGIAGQGWSLNGISAISRCRQTLSQDNNAMPITWSSDDRFCLNGQRLIVVSGSYGAPESSYRTEIDNFAVVTAKGGTLGHPSYFMVEAKDGSTSYFGNTADSKLVGSSSSPGTTTLIWSINRFKDNIGNSIDFVYEGGATDGLRINTIHYAFPTPNDGLAPTRTDSNAQVKFSYDTRTDSSSSYVTGYSFAQTKRLSKVSVNNDGKELRSYNLAYMPDADTGNRYKNRISRLEAIQECNGPTNATTCLAPLMFKWGGGSFVSLDQGSTPVNLINSSSGAYLLNNLFADANGDGKQDLIYLMYDSSQATGSSPNRAAVSVHVQYAGKPDFVMYTSTVDDYKRVRIANLDYNADGRQDIAIYDGYSWRIYLATVTADTGNGIWAKFTYIADPAITNYDTIFTDYNGDGLVDAVTSDGYIPLIRDTTQAITSSHFYKFGALVPFSFDPNDFPELKQTVSDLPAECQVRTYSKTLFPSSIGDFNGDGVADFAASVTEILGNKCSGINYTPHRSTGNYSFVVRNGKLTKYSTISTNVINIYAVDLNGDGLSDLVTDTAGLKYLYYYFINTGTGFQDNGLINLTGNTATLPPPQFLDVNGDGATDTVWYDSTATSIMVRLRGDTENKVLRANTDGGSAISHIIMDTNGDGIFDYVRVSPYQLISYPGVLAVAGAPIPCHMEAIPIPAPSANGQTYQACVGAIPNPANPVPANEQVNSIVSINNGMGNITNILYGTLSNSGHYTTTDVNPQTTTTQVNNDCSGITDHNSEAYSRCMVPSIYTSTTADSFYSRLNGGWDLPAGSYILQPNKTVSTTNTTKGAPVLEVNGSMRIVTSVNSSAPLASNVNAVSKVDYYYGEAKMQALGRGFLGFNILKTVDGQSGVTTVTTYRQDFPFQGSPLTTTVYAASSPSATVLSKATNTWNLRIGEAPGIYQPYIATSQENSYSLGLGTLLQTVTTETVIDSSGFGNPASIKITTTGQDPVSQTPLTLVKTTTNTYSSDPWELRKGRLSSSTVTTTRNNISDSSRTVSFSYYGLGDGNLRGMLKSEVVEPGDPVNTLSTLYTYDTWGNKKSVATTGLNALGQTETRTVTNTYDSKGRYLLSSLNDLGQSSVVNSRNEYGAPLAATDINGVKSQIYYDALGSEYMRVDDTGAWVRTETSYCSADCPAGAKYFIYKRMAGGGSAKTYFDVLGRTIRSSTVGMDGRNTFVDTEYDSSSRVARQSVPYVEGTTPAGWTSYVYDLIGRPSQVTAPDNSKTDFVYINLDTNVGNALNQTRTETRNGLGQLIQVKDNLGGTISYAYTVKGELLAATTTSNGSSITVRMCYDKLGRKIGMLDPDKGGFKATVTDCASFNPSAPPLGWWAYQYDAFGELVKQTDPKGQTTSMTYDIIGRMRSRTDKLAGGALDNYTRWYYDTQIDGSPQVGAKGKPTAIINNSDASQNCSATSHCTFFAYDTLTRPVQTMVMYPGDSTGYMSITKYDDFGRPYEQHDPLEGPVLGVSGTQTHYNQYGYAYETVDLATGKTLQRTLTTNARGQVLTELRGNGAITTNTYNDQTGLLLNQNATVLGFGQPIQNNTYTWDVLGNLKTRQSQSATIGSTGSKNLSETFYYDGLNRLIKTTGSSNTATPSCNGNTQDISYDGFGNITCKNGVGNYAYGTNAGPHAVTSTTTDGAYTYDGNGNQIGGAGRTLDYTSYDMVKTISKSSDKTEFKYGPDRARYQRIDTRAIGTTTTTYIGNIERIQTGASIEWKRYVGGAIFTYKTNTTNTLQLTDTRYLYNDHLGSLDVITDSVGRVTHSESFDPWGARRGGEDWKTYSPSSLNIASFDRPITQRGFTGHEMVDDMNIIHMNGRIYDSRLGRFLQADPFIQAGANTQSYNRYSYVLNNPLNMVDPSGFFWDPLGGFKQGAIRALVKAFGAQLVNVVGTAICSYYGHEYGAAAWNYEFSKAMGASNKAALTSAAIAYVAANVFQSIGEHFSDLSDPFSTGNVYEFGGNYLTAGQIASQIGAHAIAGGIFSVLQGGKFGNGFIAAGVTKGFTNVELGLAGNVNSLGGIVVGTVVSATIGGTVSEMAGGKFANGANTAAFQFLFNAAATVQKKSWWDSVKTDSKLMSGFKQGYPEEYELFVKYAKSLDVTNLSTVDGAGYGEYDEAAWQGFDPWVRATAQDEILNLLAEQQQKSLDIGWTKSAGDEWSKILWGAVKSGYSGYSDVQKLVNRVSALENLSVNGPKVINESGWSLYSGNDGYSNPQLKTVFH